MIESVTNKKFGQSPRRTVLKTIGASAIGLGLGSSVTTAQSGFSADFGEALDPEESKVTSGVTSRYVGGSVKAVTNHWDLLVHDHEATREYVRASSLSGAELGKTISFLNQLWKDYPTTEVPDDGRLRIALEDDAKSPTTLSRDDRSNINKASSAVQEGIASMRGAQAEWHPVTHRKLTAEAGRQLNVSSAYVDTIRTHADDPDNWSCGGCVQAGLQAAGYGWIPIEAQNALADAINQVAHSYTHYYNPNLKWCYLGYCYNIGSFGGAPGESKKYLNQAKNQAYLVDAFKKMAWAGHYVSDCAQPLHTSLELKQAEHQWVHYDYESWVGNNWGSGKNFKSDFQYNSSYYPIISPSQAVKDIASVSNEDAWNLYDTIYSNPNSWKNDSAVESITAAAMKRAGLYVRGYVKEIQDAF